MASVLGLRGTGSFTVTGQRPLNWREKILQLFPNGKAPLCALLAMLKSESTDDPTFNWFEKRVASTRLQVGAGGQAIGDTAFTVVAADTGLPANNQGALSLRNGSVLMVESTGELVLLTADPTVDTAIPTVTRGFGTTGAAAIPANGYLTRVGNVNEEGGALPSAVGFDPTQYFNYTQIFRMPIFMTRTAMKTRLRTGDQVKEAKREALEQISIDKEMSFLFGQLKLSTGAKGQPLRMTRGIISHITQYSSANVFSNVGALAESVWDGIMEQIFRYGSSEKLALCGSGFLSVLNQMAKGGKIQMHDVPTSETYGMSLLKYRTSFGDLMLKTHPLMTMNAGLRNNCVIIDSQYIKERYVDDMQYLKDRQTPGDDAKSDEYLNEAGIEVEMPETHAYITGVTSYAP